MTDQTSWQPMAVIRACVSKQRFDTIGKARKALQNHFRRRRPTSLNTYHCKHCGGFHIGNKPEI